MCHQSVGLVQAAIERAGLSTVSVTVRPEITLRSGVPRAAYLRAATGNLFGSPDQRDVQLEVLRSVLGVLVAADRPGFIAELPYRFRRPVA